jgi:hypothetical protein
MNRSKEVEATAALRVRFADLIREAQEQQITLVHYLPETGEAWRITPNGQVVAHDIGPEQTDWARVAGMTEEEIEANAAADPDAPPWSPARYARMKAVAKKRRDS